MSTPIPSQDPFPGLSQESVQHLQRLSSEMDKALADQAVIDEANGITDAAYKNTMGSVAGAYAEGARNILLEPNDAVADAQDIVSQEFDRAAREQHEEQAFRIGSTVVNQMVHAESGAGLGAGLKNRRQQLLEQRRQRMADGTLYGDK